MFILFIPSFHLHKTWCWDGKKKVSYETALKIGNSEMYIIHYRISTTEYSKITLLTYKITLNNEKRSWFNKKWQNLEFFLFSSFNLYYVYVYYTLYVYVYVYYIVSYGLWKLNELRSETRVFPTFYFNFLIIMYIIF